LAVCTRVQVTSTAFGLEAAPFIVHQLGTKLLGGTIAEYTVVLGEGSHSFAHMLTELKYRVGKVGMPHKDEEAKTLIRQVTREIGLVKLTITALGIGDSNGKYYCEDADTVRNHITNPIFFNNITDGWNQVDSGSHTITQEQKSDFDFNESGLTFPYTFPLNYLQFGDIESAARQHITASTGAAISYLRTDPLTLIEVDPSVACTLQAKIVVTELVGTLRFNLRIRWLNSSSVLISDSVTRQTALTADPVTLTVAATSPSNTKYAECRIEIETQAANDRGACYWRAVMFERRSSTSTYIDGTKPTAWWQVDDHNSVSIKSGESIIAGLWSLGA
jgi:hypothetical protein